MISLCPRCVRISSTLPVFSLLPPRMTLPRPAAIVLALVAGRVAGLVHPARAVVHAAAATTRRHRNPATRMPPHWRGVSRQCSRQCRGFVGGQTASFLQHRWCTSAAAGTALRGTHPTSAAQSIPTMKQSEQGGGGPGPPIGGYPPPEHLHGVFAVYKPKGITSSDVVQKIKV